MYRNLEAELRRLGVLRENIAEVLGINIATVSAKLTKPGRLRLDEAITIQETFFPELDLKYLFDYPGRKSA